MTPEEKRAMWLKATHKYRAKNIENVRLSKLKYRLNNKEKVKAAQDLYNEKNKEKKCLYSREYKKLNPELAVLHVNTRRARKKANGGRLSKDLIKRLLVLQKGKCACCGKPLGDDYHLDHIMPLSLGGANEDWNIQLLTASCNHHKSAKHPIDFMQSKGFLL